MSDDSRELSRMEDILSGEDYLPKKPMSRIEELLLDGAMVPKVDSTDNGKVLKVIDGEWKPGEDVSGDNLPPVSSLDNGKVLKVVNGEWNIGSDKSDIVMVQMGVSYASFKDSSQVTLPTNIKSVLLANYYNNPPVPTYLITTDSVIFQPIEVNKSSGTTPLVQIRWGRFYSYLDTVTHESNVYNDSIIYNTQDNDTIARFSKSAALQTIPPVDSTDEGKVMQVGNDGTWQANALPSYDEVPQVEAADVGKVLKATAVGEYDWGDAPDPLPTVTTSDEGKILQVNSSGEWDKGNAPRTNAVQVPPVIYDDDKLKTITIDGFPGITKVYLTAQEYAALSTAEKQDLSKIYYISDYEFYPSDDGKVVIRFNDDGTEKLIFFNGFVDDWSSTPYSNFPEELRTIVTNNAIWGSDATILSTNYNSEGVVRSGNEAFFGIRTTQDWHVNSCNSYGGNYAAKNKANYAILDMLSNTQYQLSPSWSDPYDIPYGYDAIYYGGKEYEEFYIPKELPYVTPSDEGKVLQVNSQGIWVKGDVPSTCTPVEIDAADYHALTTPQKEDTTKVYFVKAGRVITDPVSVIPRNPSSSKIETNTGSISYATSGTYAFDGTMNTPFDVRPAYADTVSAWTPGYGNTADSSWISYQFDTVTTNLVKLEVYPYCSVDSTTPVIVEGSTDGTTWFNILADGASSFTLNADDTEFVKNEIPLDNTASVLYIRFRFINKVNYYNEPSFGIAEIYAYTGNVVVYDDSTYYKGIKHGKTVKELPSLAAADEGKVLKAVNGKWSKDIVYREITQADYDLLPASKNSDGIIYFITDNS